jgi:hypothetical protein
MNDLSIHDPTKLSNHPKLHEVIPVDNHRRNSSTMGTPMNDTRDLPTQVRVEIAQHREELKEKKYDNTYKSCCFGNTDKRLCEYITQVCIGGSIIIFCAFQLTTADCHDSPAYWALLSGTVGFFLKTTMKNRD